jgi:hypothetical protein
MCYSRLKRLSRSYNSTHHLTPPPSPNHFLLFTQHKSRLKHQTAWFLSSCEYHNSEKLDESSLSTCKCFCFHQTTEWNMNHIYSQFPPPKNRWWNEAAPGKTFTICHRHLKAHKSFSETKSITRRFNFGVAHNKQRQCWDLNKSVMNGKCSSVLEESQGIC